MCHTSCLARTWDEVNLSVPLQGEETVHEFRMSLSVVLLVMVQGEPLQVAARASRTTRSRSSRV